jgi:hypothetical protein
MLTAAPLESGGEIPLPGWYNRNVRQGKSLTF